MVNLPNTRADMLPNDFEGIAEVLKGKRITIEGFVHLKIKICHHLLTLLSIQTCMTYCETQKKM